MLIPALSGRARLRRLALGLCAAGLATVAAAPACATVYYVDSARGDDAWSGTLPLRSGSSGPWKSLARLNSATLMPGDVVKFRAGSDWSETLQLRNGVQYTVHGVLPRPIIRGSNDIAGLAWAPVPDRPNVWVADTAGTVLQGSQARHLFIETAAGSVQRLTRARWPNPGEGVFARAGAGKSQFARAGAVSLTENTESFDGTLRDATDSWASRPAADLVGAMVYARTSNYTLVRFEVMGASAGQLQLQARRMDDPLVPRPGWNNADFWRMPVGAGYRLENKLWMLDQPGEWVHDTSAGKVYVRLPDNTSPTALRNAGHKLMAAVRDHAVVGQNVTQTRDLRISGLDLRQTRRAALQINDTKARFVLNDLVVSDTGGRGIDLERSSGLTGSVVSNSVVRNTDAEGINVGERSANISVNANAVQGVGRGFWALAGIALGTGGEARGNQVSDTAYIGIHSWKQNVVDGNVVRNVCLELDDCGGIYTVGYWATRSDPKHHLNSTFSNNLVLGNTARTAPAMLDGRPDDNVRVSDTKGIYLDDYAGKVTVTGNQVTGFDAGTMIHLGRDNTFTGNVFFNNERSQVWMLEDLSSPNQNHCEGAANCDPDNPLVGNVFTGNVLVTNRPTTPLIEMDSGYAGVNDFATFSGNRLGLRMDPTGWVPPLVMRWTAPVSPRAGNRVQGAVQWNAWKPNWDTTASALGQAESTLEATGTNLAVNGNLAEGPWGWFGWNGNVTFVSGAECAAGQSPCAKVTRTGTAASSNPVVNVAQVNAVTIKPNTAYLLSFDARSSGTTPASVDAGIRDQDSITVPAWDVAIRRTVSVGSTWQNHQRYLLTTGGATNIALELTTVPGQPGDVVYLDNIRLVEMAAQAAPFPTVTNETGTALSVDCLARFGVACNDLVDMQTGAPVSTGTTFSVPPRSAKVLHNRQSPLAVPNLN